MKILFIILKFSLSLCIWPPPYKIHLNHSEEFVIFESFGDNDDIYSDEDEMIKMSDLQKLGLDKDNEKYYKIHKYAMEMGKKQPKPFGGNPKNYITRIKWKERNFENEDDIPYIAGIFDSKNPNMLRENTNVFYYNEMAKSMVNRDIFEKREIDVIIKKSIPQNETDYDYKEYKKEYDEEVKKLKTAADTLQFVNVKEEESAQEAVGKIMNFSKPLNCTAEEAKGIGLTAIKCFVDDFKNPKTKNKGVLLRRISKLVIIWFAVYLIIAIPLWCQKGWCCCCFRCKCCRPKERIDEIKRFLANNPPGTFRNAEGVIVKYKPTHYERYSQKRLEQAIMKL